MNKQQKMNALQGFVFGMFFQILGYLMKEYFEKWPSLYLGGYASLTMGYIMLAWGSWYIVQGKKLPQWLFIFGFHIIGFILLLLVPARKKVVQQPG